MALAPCVQIAPASHDWPCSAVTGLAACRCAGGYAGRVLQASSAASRNDLLVLRCTFTTAVARKHDAGYTRAICSSRSAATQGARLGLIPASISMSGHSGFTPRMSTEGPIRRTRLGVERLASHAIPPPPHLPPSIESIHILHGCPPAFPASIHRPRRPAGPAR